MAEEQQRDIKKRAERAEVAMNAVSEAKEEKQARRVKKADDAEILLFGKYSMKDLDIRDQGLLNYINLTPRKFPNTYGRRSSISFYFSHVNIVERFANKLMRGGTGQKVSGKIIRTEGRLQGKKLKVVKIVEDAFGKIQSQTGKNPIQILINAIQNAAPIEDTTRVRYGGITYNVAVDISAVRRVNVALRNLALAAIIGAFKNRKTLADSIASELILTGNKDPNSYAVKKRVESERMAKAAR